MQNNETQFSSIFESGMYSDLLELSDANLRTDDGCNFDVHRVILAKRNNYFRRMFLGMGKSRRKFLIPGISGGCLSDILTYIYTKDIEITDRNIADLIVGADYLLVEGIQMCIRTYIKENLTEVNCCRILPAAHQTSDEYIFRKCFRFIQTRFEGIMRCHMDELVFLPADILEMILSNHSLSVYNETTVWQAIVAWTQKDIALRESYVPRLLLTLATEDMEEELATEILQHEIISRNCFMKDLAEIASSYDLSTNIEVLLTLLQSYSNCFKEPILRHRIPPQLFVAWDLRREQSLYISYDENTDLWRKITEVRHQPAHLIVIGHNVYIFDDIDKTCKKFDLRAMRWVRMRSFRNTHSSEYCVVAIDESIYLLSEARGLEAHVVQVYSTLSDRWHNSAPLRNISHFAAVAIEKKIYVVGNSEIPDRMMMQMFDPDSEQWSIMSPPTVHHSSFSVVAYHQKIFLIGDSVAEVFDPATNLWKELPGAFDKRSSPIAIVISDQIIVNDTDGCSCCNEFYKCWNNTKECWENIAVNDTIKGHFSYCSMFCIVDDIETIRMITKKNRDPLTHMKNIDFVQKHINIIPITYM